MMTDVELIAADAGDKLLLLIPMTEDRKLSLLPPVTDGGEPFAAAAAVAREGGRATRRA